MSDDKIRYEHPQVPESIDHEYYLSVLTTICQALGLEGDYETDDGVGQRIGMARIRRIVLRPDGFDVEAYSKPTKIDPDTDAVLTSTFTVPVEFRES